MNAIEVKNLTKIFKQYKKESGFKGTFNYLFNRKSFNIEAVSDISFNIKNGERVAFIGPNGAGKTTTLKILSGILYPTSGYVSVLGFTPSERKKEFLKQLSFVMGQKSQLWWELPPIDSFELNKEIYEIPSDHYQNMLNELSEILEIKDLLLIPVKKLSLGQRMKCEIAASLLHNPKVVFLDEPTIGLDIIIQKKIRQFIKQYFSSNDRALILTSHNMDDIKEVCDRVIIINKGKVLYDNSLSNLNRKYINNKYLKIDFNVSVNCDELSKYGKIRSCNPNGLSAILEVPIKEHTKIATEILNKYSVDNIDISEVEIEEIISKFYQK